MFKPLSEADAKLAKRWRPPEIEIRVAEAAAEAVLRSLAEQSSAGEVLGAPPEVDRTEVDEQEAVAPLASQTEAQRLALFEEGFAAGSAAAREAFSDDFATLAVALRRDSAVTVAELEHEVVTLACRMAEAVLRRELVVSIDDFRQLVREALVSLDDSGIVPVVRLHPIDAGLLESCGGLGARVVIEPDDRIERADCCLVAGASLIDASVVARIRALGVCDGDIIDETNGIDQEET